MKIIVASENKSKIQAVSNVFPGQDIDFCSAESGVSSKPINNETILGAYNRVNNIKQDSDLKIAIEGGYFIVDEKYYLADICCIKSPLGFQFGNSDLFTISKNMFDCIRNEISLSSIIKELNGYSEDKSDFKQGLGIVGYLSNGKYYRSFGNAQAVLNAQKNKISKLEDYKPIFNSEISLHGKRYDILDKECAKYLKKLYNSL